jgi:hypothetical protein
MTRGRCRACDALMYTREPRRLCDACTERANDAAYLAHVAEQERFDAMTDEEREVYYAAAEAAWRQEEYGRLDA